jgi:hypothetical protein
MEIDWTDVLELVDRRIDDPVTLRQALAALQNLRSDIETRIDGLRDDLRMRGDDNE